MKLISIVIPVYNEEPNITNCHIELIKHLDSLSDKYNFEIIFCDNCSTDKSWELISKLSQNDNRVKGIKYSRNFGYQRSIYMGYLQSKGDATIQFDCDLQDPPELLKTFLEEWEKGNTIVYGKRRKRQESLLMNICRKVFYRLSSFLSEEDLPIDVGEFRLIGKEVIEQLREINDHQPYLRGLIATLGFQHSFIEYDRNARTLGETKFNIRELFRIAFDGIFTYSVIPLRIATYFGLMISFISLSWLVGLVIYKVFFAQGWPAGYTTITLLILITMGINALFLGIIGEYLGRIYKQSKKSPIAIIEKTSK